MHIIDDMVFYFWHALSIWSLAFSDGFFYSLWFSKHILTGAAVQHYKLTWNIRYCVAFRLCMSPCFLVVSRVYSLTIIKILSLKIFPFNWSEAFCLLGKATVNKAVLRLIYLRLLGISLARCKTCVVGSIKIWIRLTSFYSDKDIFISFTLSVSVVFVFLSFNPFTPCIFQHVL